MVIIGLMGHGQEELLRVQRQTIMLNILAGLTFLMEDHIVEQQLVPVILGVATQAVLIQGAQHQEILAVLRVAQLLVEILEVQHLVEIVGGRQVVETVVEVLVVGQ